MIKGDENGGYAGWNVRSAGDVNGDDFNDLIVGAYSCDATFNGSLGTGKNEGGAFVIYGGDFSDVATRIGTTCADALTATADDDLIVTGTGDDTITGGGVSDHWWRRV